MPKLILAIDNGASGSMAVLFEGRSWFWKTPCVHQQSYTKKKQNISRLNVLLFWRMLDRCISKADSAEEILVVMERPVTGARFQKAVISGMRFLEAILVCLELRRISYRYIDSKEWQRSLLPKGVKGDQLKKASRDIGIRKFPVFREEIEKHRDADSLLIAEYARLMRW